MQIASRGNLPPRIAIAKEALGPSILGLPPDTVGQMYLPAGIRASFIDNLAQVNVVPGYAYIGKQALDGKVVVVRTRLFMRCAGPGAPAACLPVQSALAGQGYQSLACAMGSCKGKLFYNADGGSFVELAEGGFVRADFDVRIAQSAERLPLAFAAMQAVPGIQRALERFYKRHYKATQPPAIAYDAQGRLLVPEGHVAVMLNVAGRAMPGIVPAAAVQAGLHALVQDFYCRCEAAAGTTLPIERQWLGGKYILCQSDDCATATLKAGIDSTLYPVFSY